MGTCFIAQPRNSTAIEMRYHRVLEPAIVAAGLSAHRIREDLGLCSYAHKIESAIHEATCLLAEVTEDHPEVWFWVGFAIAHHKEVVFVCGAERTAPLQCGEEHSILRYDIHSPDDDFERRLISRLHDVKKRHTALKNFTHSFPAVDLDDLVLSASEMNTLVIVKDNLLSPEDCDAQPVAESHDAHGILLSHHHPGARNLARQGIGGAGRKPRRLLPALSGLS